MTSWKTYILFATILPLVKTENNQRGHKLETTTILSSQQPYGYEEMSEEHKIEVGNRIEPVIFEPQRKIKLSRSTYKVTSYVDFKPYKQSFKQFGQYMGRFLVNLHDPHYISTLYNAGRYEGDPLIRRGAGVIDPNYTGEIMILLINTASRVHPIMKGDPIAQLILEKVSIPILRELKELPSTTRGAHSCGF